METTGSPLKAEPSSRWVKRLKSSSSDSPSVGTKSSKDDEESSQQFLNNFSKRSLWDIKTSSDPTVGGKALDSDQSMSSRRAGELSSADSAEKDIDLLLSYSWIQRLLHGRAATLDKKPEINSGVKSQSSKLGLEDIYEKQFPCIAAMAFMGKAITGFPTFDLQNRGSFVVWNSRSFQKGI